MKNFAIMFAAAFLLTGCPNKSPDAADKATDAVAEKPVLDAGAPDAAKPAPDAKAPDTGSQAAPDAKK